MHTITVNWDIGEDIIYTTDTLPTLKSITLTNQQPNKSPLTTSQSNLQSNRKTLKQSSNTPRWQRNPLPPTSTSNLPSLPPTNTPNKLHPPLYKLLRSTLMMQSYIFHHIPSIANTHFSPLYAPYNSNTSSAVTTISFLLYANNIGISYIIHYITNRFKCIKKLCWKMLVLQS